MGAVRTELRYQLFYEECGNGLSEGENGPGASLPLRFVKIRLFSPRQRTPALGAFGFSTSSS